MKLMTKEIAAKLVPNYQHSAETGESAQEVVVKYFTPWANASWYISEGIPVTEDGEPVAAEFLEFAIDNADKYDWHLYGFCDLGMGPGCSELGYVMLNEIKGLQGPVGLKVERDLYYSGSMADVIGQYRAAA